MRKLDNSHEDFKSLISVTVGDEVIRVTITQERTFTWRFWTTYFCNSWSWSDQHTITRERERHKIFVDRTTFSDHDWLSNAWPCIRSGCREKYTVDMAIMLVPLSPQLRKRCSVNINSYTVDMAIIDEIIKANQVVTCGEDASCWFKLFIWLTGSYLQQYKVVIRHGNNK